LLPQERELTLLSSTPGPDFFRYQVLNETTIGTFNVTDQVEFEKLIKIADETDPGQTNAIEGDISAFLKRGKLATYVGLADTLIPTGSTLWYREHVRKTLGYPSNLDDSYRTFAGTLSPCCLVFPPQSKLTLPGVQYPVWLTVREVTAPTTLVPLRKNLSRSAELDNLRLSTNNTTSSSR
jgi:hypothetical protein